MSLRLSLGLVLLLAGFVTATACSVHEGLHDHLMNHTPSQSDRDLISGEWDVSFKVHDTSTPATFSLKLEGDKVTGTVYSEHTGAGTIREGSWSNQQLKLVLEFKKHDSIEVTGTLKDGKLSGEFRTEGFVANWDGVKKHNR